MKLDVESLLNTRWIGVVHASLIILSFGLPWVYPEDYGNTASVYGIAQTTGFELTTFGDIMGFLISGAIMVASAIYLVKRWRGHVAIKVSITMFALVAIYPILATGAIEKVWLGYIATLLLCAPTPAVKFVDWTHRKLKPHGSLRSACNSIYGATRAKITRPSGNSP